LRSNRFDVIFATTSIFDSWIEQAALPVTADGSGVPKGYWACRKPPGLSGIKKEPLWLLYKAVAQMIQR
jgi:hypothetical protein